MDNRIKLLLIEDNIHDALYFNEHLHRIHSQVFEITHCLRLNTAIETINKNNFDIIVTDLTLPDSYGLNTFLEVKKYAGGIPIVINSGISDMELTMEAIRAGAQDYINKSTYQGDAIYHVLLFAIERKKLTSELEEAKNLLFAQTEELKKLNNELYNLNLDKDRFYSIVSHDLVNPFNTLLSFSDMLQESYNELSDTERKEYSGYINSLARKILTLVKNLLHWTALNTGRIEFKPNLLKLGELLYEIIEFHQFAAKNKNIELTYTNSGSISVEADKFMIETVLRNLISNAIKFTNTGGHVAVNMFAKNNLVVIEVEDNGVGMSEDDTSRLFNVGEVKSKKGTYLETGTGLGLVLCKELLTINSGTIEVKSELDRGTTFTVTLPMNA